MQTPPQSFHSPRKTELKQWYPGVSHELIIKIANEIITRNRGKKAIRSKTLLPKEFEEFKGMFGEPLVR